MAQAPRQTGGEGAADFIRHIVTDPKNVPDVMLLSGYLGASSEDGHERLYASPDLTNYVEIPQAAILHRAPLPAEQDAHGGVTLWVKKDAALQYKMAPAAQALANYFAGAIQAGAQAAAPAPQPMPATLGGPVCGVTLPNVCQVVSAACTFFEPGCRTRQATCFVDCTVLGPACQSHFHTCAPCQLTQRTPCQGASCGVDCTVIFCPTLHAPCPTQQHTPCPGVSCGFDCTVFGPACQSIHVGTCFVQCNPTHGQPQCPFPTEVTCNPVCHLTFAQPCVASPAPACGPNVTIGGCSVACLPGQFPGQPGPVAQAALARGVAPAAQQITLGGPACGGTVGNFCTVFGPCDLWTTDTICCPIGNWTFNCQPTPVNPCVTQHPLQCTLACTRPPQCIVETMNALCVTRNLLHCSVVCTQPGQCLQSVNHCVTVFATCVTCNPAFCQIGPGQVPPGTPVEQRQAFVSAGPDCSIAGNCTRFTPCVI